MEEPPMQRFIVLALTVFALAAVPVALADDGTTTPPAGSSDPAAQQQTPNQAGGQRLEILRLRLQLVELRFAKHCGANSDGAAQRCLDVAQKVEDRLTKLDGNVQAQIAKIQSTCTSTSTDDRCKHAADRIALLQKVDTRVKALAQKVADWLAGKTVSTDPGSDSSLDQAAAGLGKLTQQAGGNG
jgi:hypothetical protein